MNKYITPEMEALVFISEEAISAPLIPGPSGKDTNDGELEWGQTMD